MDKRQAEKLVYSLYSNSDSLYIVRMTSYRIFMFYYNGCKRFFVVRGPASCRSNKLDASPNYIDVSKLGIVQQSLVFLFCYKVK